MKNLLLTTLIIFIAFAVVAQSDTKAKSILDEVSAKTKNFKTIKIEFTYKMENPAQKISESFNGTLFSKGDNYKLIFSGQEVFSDGKNMWTFLKDANEVQINEAENTENSFSPTNLLSSYNENFKAKLIQENSKQYIIELTPIQKKNFNKVRIVTDKTKKIVNSLTVFDKNGSTYTYIVNKFETEIPFKDNMFTFRVEDHPGVDVIDMR
ncbi:MAG: outer membrane lipoprotein carrier protein LolA [Lentimicrobium sp.]|nr:outer membrane lipoprotein carrier protein LolA [Lentimicrobium sp.]